MVETGVELYVLMDEQFQQKLFYFSHLYLIQRLSLFNLQKFYLKTDSGKFYAFFEKTSFDTCRSSARTNINFAV